MTFSTFGAAIFALFAPGQQAMTLDDAIRIAESNSFSLRTAASNIEKSHQRVNEVKGNLGPKVSANATYTVSNTPSTTVNTGGTGSTGGTTGGTGGTTGGTGGSSGGGVSIPGSQSQVGSVSLTLPIDISGTTRRSIRAAEDQYKAALQTYRVADNDLRQNVKQGYYQVLQAKAQIAVAQESVTNAQSRLTNAQQKLAAGSLARFDVLRFQTALSQAQSDLLVAQNALEVAKNNFNNTLSRPINTPFDLVDVTTLPTVPNNPDQLVAQAISLRPEIQAQQFQIEALQNIVKATEAGMDPSLAIGASHNRLFLPGTATTAFSQSSAFVSLSVPIFDSGITRARVKEARQDVTQAQITLDQTSLGVSLEVRQALTNLTNAQSRLTVAQQQVSEAAETYRLALVKFNAGEGTTLDVTDAQTQLTTARTNLVSSRYDYLRAYAALQRAIYADTANAPTPQEMQDVNKRAGQSGNQGMKK